MTTCEEAKQMRSGINIQGKIEDKGEVRTVNTKFGETKVCDAYLADDSGRIKLTPVSYTHLTLPTNREV